MTLSDDDDEFVRVWRETPQYEVFLRRLRERGLSKLESVKNLRRVCGISLAEAKRVVLLSETWKDTLEASERLHTALHDAILEDENEGP